MLLPSVTPTHRNQILLAGLSQSGRQVTYDANEESPTTTATSLLRRAAQRDTVAWERLVTLYAPLVYNWCRKWGLQPEDAENVGQETFLKLARGLPHFRRERPGDAFHGWLYRVARNCFIDYLRGQRTGVVGTGGSDAALLLHSIPAESIAEEESYPSQAEKRFLYRKAVDLIRSEFSEREWPAFYRVVIEERCPHDVAAELATTPNVIYLGKSRILRRLREEFEGLIAEDW